MKTFFKIVGTLVIIILTVYVLCFSIAAVTSSGMSEDEQQGALTWSIWISIFGILSIIALWLPWKKDYKK